MQAGHGRLRAWELAASSHRPAARGVSGVRRAVAGEQRAAKGGRRKAGGQRAASAWRAGQEMGGPHNAK